MNSEALHMASNTNLSALLCLEDLRFAYSEGKDIVSNIQLDIAAGDFHCLIGRSGCGKTSLLKLAAGLLQKQHGRVRWRGHTIDTPQEDMAFVFQRPTLLGWLNVMDNVLLPVSLHRPLVPTDITKAQGLLVRMGLRDCLTRKPAQLSGGQQSRVAIARAFMGDPRILFLDEPFAALDAITREEIQNELMALCEDLSTTVLFVTHDIAEAVFLGDHVSLMTNGQIRTTYPIELDRPRKNALRRTPAFNAYCTQLRLAMEEQA